MRPLGRAKTYSMTSLHKRFLLQTQRGGAVPIASGDSPKDSWSAPRANLQPISSQVEVNLGPRDPQNGPREGPKSNSGDDSEHHYWEIIELYKENPIMFVACKFLSFVLYVHSFCYIVLCLLMFVIRFRPLHSWLVRAPSVAHDGSFGGGGGLGLCWRPSSAQPSVSCK